MKKMIKAACAMAAITALACSASWAADDAASKRVTFYKDVLPIMQESCMTCHRPVGSNMGGMIAPMAFTTFEDTRPWAKSIARQVSARDMPPWFATHEFNGVFVNERVLSDEQIGTIVGWVAQGAKRGDPDDAPPAISYVEDTTDGWTIGKPDLIISMEPYFIEDSVEDINISFQTVLSEAEMPTDMWIKAIEYKAGSEIVHHICNSASAPEDRDDLAAFERNGLGCIAPGSDTRTVPEGFGTFLPKGATIRWGMHYHKEPGPGTALWDQSQMAFIFSKEPVKHRVRFDIIDSGNRWELPPTHGNWLVGAARVLEEDTLVLSYLPHMHYRGKAALYTAFYPDGTEEKLLDVDKYDYNWQSIYRYEEPKFMPAGTRIEVKMWFDNSEETPQASILDTDRAVRFGLPTTDEMMNGWIGYANADEVDFDSDMARAQDAADTSSD